MPSRVNEPKTIIHLVRRFGLIYRKAMRSSWGSAASLDLLQGVAERAYQPVNF